MADYFTHFSCLLDAGSPENAAKAMALFHRLRAEEADADEPAFNGFDLVQQDGPGGSQLWIHDDDQGDVEGVINFVLRLAEELNLSGLWGFDFAHTCSRPRVEALGGGAHVIDLGARKSLGWISTHEWRGHRRRGGGRRMNTTVPIIPASPSRFLPVVEFGRSADDLLVARVGDTAFAMVPARQGRHFLATGWRLSRPLDTWRRGDFYGHSGDVADEAAFRALVAENAEHQRERAALGRREVGSRAHTPWGASEGAMTYGEGVLCHSTAGHGGFQLAPEQNARVHPLLRSSSGFYEEDAEWAAVAQALPELFTGYERRLADDTLRNHWPDAWEAIHGCALQPGESRERDRQTFERQHAADWIVISAVSSDRFPGFVETTATPGAKRGPSVERRRFLVPSVEYEPGLFGFVIDPARHQDLTDGTG